MRPGKEDDGEVVVDGDGEDLGVYCGVYGQAIGADHVSARDRQVSLIDCGQPDGSSPGMEVNQNI
jgi:hypothetical protein